MRLGLGLRLLLAGVVAFLFITAAGAAEKRIALVVGEAAYRDKPLATAANDAGLVAQTLQAAGFDVAGARDLDEEALRHAFRDFLDKASAAGPDTVAFIYLSGYGLQLEGENYLAPVDAAIARDSDIAIKAARLSDYLKPLAALNLKTSIVVLDIARANPFTLAGPPIASGLALYEPGANMLLAYNAAPGTIAPAETETYGVYARALAEMMRVGGTPLNEVFEKARLRVADATKGAQLPWNSTKLATPFLFFERAADAPPPPTDEAALSAKSIRELGPRDGYIAAVQRDTVQDYQDYLALYPQEPSAKRVRAYLAARREAISWRRARSVDTMNGYWTYLRRYPRGPHAADARRRLAQIDAALEPPPEFEVIDMGLAPPPPEEIVYVDRPVLIFDDPAFDLPPPPPPPVYVLPPPAPIFLAPEPPIVVADPYVLPAPVFTPLPVWESPPVYVEPPPQNVIFENIHNTVIVDRAANAMTIRNPSGQVLSTGALTAIGAGAAGLAIGAALPSFVAKKAAPAIAPAAPPPAQPGDAPGGPHSGAPALPGGMPPVGAALPPANQVFPGQHGAGGPHLGAPHPGALAPVAAPAAGGAAPPANHALPGAPHPGAPLLPGGLPAPGAAPAAGHPALGEAGPHGRHPGAHLPDARLPGAHLPGGPPPGAAENLPPGPAPGMRPHRPPGMGQPRPEAAIDGPPPAAQPRPMRPRPDWPREGLPPQLGPGGRGSGAGLMQPPRPVRPEPVQHVAPVPAAPAYHPPAPAAPAYQRPQPAYHPPAPPVAAPAYHPPAPAQPPAYQRPLAAPAYHPAPAPAMPHPAQPQPAQPQPAAPAHAAPGGRPNCHIVNGIPVCR